VDRGLMKKDTEKMTNEKIYVLAKQEMLREACGLVVDVFQESGDGKYTGLWKADVSKLGHYQDAEFPTDPIVGDDYYDVLEQACEYAKSCFIESHAPSNPALITLK
jgi:hypothetical protein